MPLDNPTRNSIGLKQASRYFVRLVKLIRPFWKFIGKGVLLGPIIGMLAVVAPFLTKLLFDSAYPLGSITLMQAIVLGILVVTATSTLADTALQYYTSYINVKLNSVFNLHFLNHLQHLPSSFFVRQQVGEIQSRFMDGQTALTAIVNTVQVVFGQGIYLLVVPPFLLLLNWKLALIALVAIPVTGLITVFSGKYMRSSWQEVAETNAGFEALQVEVLTQVQTFKGLGLEHYNYKRAAAMQQKILKAHLRANTVSSALTISDRLISALNTALFTWLGWRAIIQGEMSLGDYMAFFAYVGYMYGPFSTLISLFNNFQHAAVNLDRVYEYLDTQPEQDPTQAFEEPAPIRVPVSGNIQLNDVSFHYHEGQTILKQINLELKAGRSYGLVGLSGSGKTTLLRLLSRFEEPVSGSISYDGNPAAEVPLIDLRRQTATVWQEVQLIRGNVWENLTLGLDTIDKAEVLEIIELAQLGPVIEALPHGLNTEVSEWGSSLSGGQRQRFAIARALIRKPRILILDEATSNLDAHTETRLIEALLAYTKKHGITTIFVTHRVNNLVSSDQIFILEQGQVRAAGTYDHLAETDSKFQSLIGNSADDMATGNSDLYIV